MNPRSVRQTHIVNEAQCVWESDKVSKTEKIRSENKNTNLELKKKKVQVKSKQFIQTNPIKIIIKLKMLYLLLFAFLVWINCCIFQSSTSKLELFNFKFLFFIDNIYLDNKTIMPQIYLGTNADFIRLRFSFFELKSSSFPFGCCLQRISRLRLTVTSASSAPTSTPRLFSELKSTAWMNLINSLKKINNNWWRPPTLLSLLALFFF